MNQLFVFFLCVCISFSAHAQERDLSNIPASKLKAMGKTSLQMGDTYSAIDYFEAYCAKKEDPKIMYTLAQCHRLARNYPEAKKWYEQAYKASPNKHPLALYYFATMLKTEGQYQEAKRHFITFRKAYKVKNSTPDYRRLANYQIIACDTARYLMDSVLAVAISHLPGSVNKASIEFSPQYYSDSILLYASLRTDTAVYTVTDVANTVLPVRKFYTAQRQNDAWNFVSEWNEGQFNEDNINVGNGVFSLDKKRFYYTRCEQNWKFETICKIYVSHKQGRTWTQPEPLPEIINAKNSTNTQPTIGNESKRNEEVLYFVSNREGGRGGYDIWYSIYLAKKKEWREPKNCGPKINTTGNEVTPFYDVKTRSLYFSSDAWPGLGELDIFRAIGELSKFDNPQNVGYPINSPFDDLYYTLHTSSKEGFFTSNRPGTVSYSHATCCDDIFHFQFVDYIELIAQGKVYEIYNKKIQDILETKTVLGGESSKKDSLVKNYVQGSVVTLYLHDKASKDKIFIATDTTDIAGAYSFELDVNRDYILEFESNKIPPLSRNISTKGYVKSDTIRVDDVGVEFLSKEPIIIKNIYYDFDKFKLTSDAQQTIDSTLLIILREAPHIIIELSSHTDSKGDDDYNLVLSQKRAESVVAYLIKKGIDKNRLYAKGYGESQPIAPNEHADGTDNAEGRQKNRRTEFRVIGTLNQYSEIIYEE